MKLPCCALPDAMRYLTSVETSPNPSMAELLCWKYGGGTKSNSNRAAPIRPTPRLFPKLTVWVPAGVYWLANDSFTNCTRRGSGVTSGVMRAGCTAVMALLLGGEALPKRLLPGSGGDRREDRKQKGEEKSVEFVHGTAFFLPVPRFCRSDS